MTIVFGLCLQAHNNIMATMYVSIDGKNISVSSIIEDMYAYGIKDVRSVVFSISLEHATNYLLMQGIAQPIAFSHVNLARLDLMVKKIYKEYGNNINALAVIYEDDCVIAQYNHSVTSASTFAEALALVQKILASVTMEKE